MLDIFEMKALGPLLADLGRSAQHSTSPNQKVTNRHDRLQPTRTGGRGHGGNTNGCAKALGLTGAVPYPASDHSLYRFRNRVPVIEAYPMRRYRVCRIQGEFVR